VATAQSQPLPQASDVGHTIQATKYSLLGPPITHCRLLQKDLLPCPRKASKALPKALNSQSVKHTLKDILKGALSKMHDYIYVFCSFCRNQKSSQPCIHDQWKLDGWAGWAGKAGWLGWLPSVITQRLHDLQSHADKKYK
jgi:hypothetical protein